MACYTVREAAHHVKVPDSTLRLWIAGRPPLTEPVIDAASKKPWILSFWNLIEAQVLVQIRRKHNVSMQKVRKALIRVQDDLGLDRPLIQARFETDGVDLFVRDLAEGHLIDAASGETLSTDLKLSLQRIDHDPGGLASSYYPWAADPREPKTVRVDPETAFGKPVVSGTAVPTSVLAGRAKAGDPLKTLARDYDLSVQQIKNAIKWETASGQAAA